MLEERLSRALLALHFIALFFILGSYTQFGIVHVPLQTNIVALF